MAYRLLVSHILSCAQGKGAFGAAAVDVFQFSCKDVGQMQMLRIGHNNKGASPDWHLHKVSCSRCSMWKFIVLKPEVTAITRVSVELCEPAMLPESMTAVLIAKLLWSLQGLCR